MTNQALIKEKKKIFKFIHVVLTVNCILRCKMCFNWKNKEEDEIEAEHIKEAIDQLYKNDLFADDFTVNFGGAEALLRKDVFDLVKFVSDKDLAMAVCTSGYLYNEDISRKIKDSGLRTIALPLDSLDEKKHDHLRGVDGVYAKAMEIIREHPGKVALTCTISAYNIDEVCRIAEWVEANDNVAQMGFQAIITPFNSSGITRGDWFGSNEFAHLWPRDLKAVNDNIDRLIKIRGRSKKIYTTEKHLNFFKEYFKDPAKINRDVKCKVGEYSITIMNKGDVVFCHDIEPLGNIRQTSIMEMLSSHKVADIKKKMLDCKRVCEFYVNCFFED
ncbi:radical SAM/SPASM domain-containing protein [Candidatus Omnitrophota bacterium]